MALMSMCAVFVFEMFLKPLTIEIAVIYPPLKDLSANFFEPFWRLSANCQIKFRLSANYFSDLESFRKLYFCVKIFRKLQKKSPAAPNLVA